MKQLFLLLLTVSGLSLPLVQCQQKENPIMLQQRFTYEQVRAIAAEYGVESQVTEEWTALLYMTPEELRSEFKARREFEDQKREMAIYFQKTADVRTPQDDIDLINSLPVFRKKEVEAQGGEAGFQKWCAELLEVKWHIYRNKDGVLKYVAADIDPDGTDVFGERIDNKPRK